MPLTRRYAALCSLCGPRGVQEQSRNFTPDFPRCAATRAPAFHYNHSPSSRPKELRMSGHSRWSTIKHKKGAADARRGKLFTRLIKEMTIAARMGGGDVNGNARLRAAVAEAKASNMPKDTIERAIKRGTGEIEGATYEEVTYEGYGPGGVAIIVEAMTDNANRTTPEIRHVFEKNGGNLGTPGSVKFQFDRKGYFAIEKKAIDEDKLMEIALEAGRRSADRQSRCVRGLHIAGKLRGRAPDAGEEQHRHGRSEA